jgi:hypothetical protein
LLLVASGTDPTRPHATDAAGRGGQDTRASSISSKRRVPEAPARANLPPVRERRRSAPDRFARR